MKGKHLWYVTVRDRDTHVTLIKYIVVAPSIGEATAKATRLARSTFGGGHRIAKIEHEGTIDA